MNKKASEEKVTEQSSCVWDFIYLVPSQNSENHGERQSTLPRALCLGEYLGYVRLLVCVANHSYSSLNGRVEPPDIFHSSPGLTGLKPVILLSINSCC